MCHLIPRRALQVWVAVGGVLTCVIALCVLVLAGFLFLSEGIWGPSFTTRNLILIAATIFALLLFALGVLGFQGARKQNNFCLFVFCVGGGLLMVGLVSICLTSFLFPNAITPSQCEDPESPLRLAYITSNSTFHKFCRKDCPCNNPFWNEYSEQAQQKLIFYGYVQGDSTSAVNVMDCPEAVRNDTVVLLANVQKYFNCSGWCNAIPYYMFSDVGRGLPNGSCYSKISELLRSSGDILGWASLVSLLWLVMHAACVVGLMSKKFIPQTSNYYQLV